MVTLDTGQRQHRVRRQAQLVADLPSPGGTREEPEGEVHVLGIDGVGHRREELVVLAGQQLGPLDLPSPVQALADDPPALDEMVGVALTQVQRLAELGEALLAVLADRLQQAVARLRDTAFHDHQRPGDEVGKQLEHRAARPGRPHTRLRRTRGCSRRRRPRAGSTSGAAAR